MHAPTKRHQDSVDQVLSYVKCTPGKGLLFKKNDSREMEGFAYANWAGSVEDTKSTTSYCI